ncbi:MAG TPA: BsuPI-related putative proteinase inhibitor [Longimicrobium sp.]
MLATGFGRRLAAMSRGRYDFGAGNYLINCFRLVMKILGIVLTFVLALAAGCGRERADVADTAQDTAATAGPVTVLLDIPARVRAGEEVQIAATLVNRGQETESVPSAGPDIVITDTHGAEVWRRSRHGGKTSPVPSATLRPNEMRGSGYTWSQTNDAGQRVASGTYRIRATIPAGLGEASSAWRSVLIIQ